MGVVGVVGGVAINGWFSIGFVLGSQPFVTVVPYTLSVIPLFVMMGAFAARAGLSASLYKALLRADRPLARRACVGDGRRLRAVRLGVRLEPRDRRDHGARRDPGDARARL